MDHSKDTNAILMEAFDINDTGAMLWDPNDVLVYINKATQALISSLGGKLNITRGLVRARPKSSKNILRRRNQFISNTAAILVLMRLIWYSIKNVLMTGKIGCLNTIAMTH